MGLAASAPHPVALAREGTIERLLDERAIIALADRLDAAVDRKDWDAARAAFAPTIEVDLSAAGGPTGRMPSDELIGMWETNLFEEKTSFHLRGNHIVAFEGANQARLTSSAYAWNRLDGLPGGALWEVWGQYDYEVERSDAGWVITDFTFVPTHDRGNRVVPGAPRPQ